jgi:hypothetical protein
MRKIIAAPATPPTMPPTRTGVGGTLPPPEPPPELDVGEGGVAVAVLEVPLAPPAPRPVLEEAPDDEEADADWLRNGDDGEGDEVRVTGVELICVEDNPELKPWVFRVEVANPLGLDVPDGKVAKESTLDGEACEVTDCRETVLMSPFESVLRLPRLEDADGVADATAVDVSEVAAEGFVSEYHVNGEYGSLTRLGRVTIGLRLRIIGSRNLGKAGTIRRMR